MLVLIGWNIERLDCQRHMELQAQVTDKSLIAIGFIAPEVEVAVDRIALAAQVKQDAQQGHRVTPTAQGHQHWRGPNGAELNIIVSLDPLQ